MVNKLERILDARLPSGYERHKLLDTVDALRNVVVRAVGNQGYSSSHSAGPFEVVEPELRTMLAGSSGALEDIGGNTSALAGSAKELVELSQTAAEQRDTGNETLQHIEYDIGAVADGIGGLAKISVANLAATSVAVGVARYYGEANIARIDDLVEGQEEMIDLLDDGLSAMLDGQDEIIDMLDEGFEALCDGQETIVGNQMITIQNQKVIIEELSTVRESVTRLGDMLSVGLEQLRKNQIDAYLQSHRDAVALRSEVGNIRSDMQRHHAKTIVQRQVLAESQYFLRAVEKYKDACDQWEIGNASKAVTDILEALNQKSSHLPSLVLLGRMCAHYALWSRAKDTFYTASQLAPKQDKAKNDFEAAVLGLSLVERTVGNFSQAKTILQENIRGYRGQYSTTLAKEYLKMEAEELRRKA